MKVEKTLVQVDHERKLRALCALSDVAEPVDFSHLTALVKRAPDPETAVRGVLRKLPLSSEVLVRKWRGAITELWATHHPKVPLMSELKLSAADLREAPMWKDARALISALESRPAKLIRGDREWLIAPEDVKRLAEALPSLKDEKILSVESEWSYEKLRRCRGVLTALRLLRPLKGELVPVHSRVARWQTLPRLQQFYTLWHADAYHLNWSEYAGLWGEFMQVMQEFLPVMWEVVGQVALDQEEDRANWSMAMINALAPLWDEVGLLEMRRGRGLALRVVQQQGLPTIIDRFLLRDLLERHGLVVVGKEFGSISKFKWTEIGVAVMSAERKQKLPCGNEMVG